MSKILKVVIVLILLLATIFALQKAARSYIERKANEYLSPYFVTVKLHNLSEVELRYKFYPNLSLTCKIETDGKFLHLTPLGNNLITTLLPDKINFPLF